MTSETTTRNQSNLGYRALADRFVADIDAGILLKGAPLPSTRELAQELGVSRDTVVNCYKYLQDISYIKSAGAHGTFVSRECAQTASKFELTLDADRLSTLGKSYIEDRSMHVLASHLSNLNHGAAPREFLPVKRWRESMLRNSRPAQFQQMKYEIGSLGRSELRQALSTYLGRAKNLECSLDQIAIFNVSTSAVELLCRLILEPGDAVAVEDPGFGAIKNIALYQRLALEAVPIDNEGLLVDKLDRLKQRPKLVYVTANSNDPTGVMMSLPRRKQLLEWAKQNHAWIIEDDYDGFFLNGKRSLPTLKSLDKNNNVIYISTVWQILFPLTTIGFVVMPDNLMPVLERGKTYSNGMAEAMEQLALAELLNDGYFHRHTRKLEKVLGNRFRILTHELKRTLRTDVSISSQGSGINCVIRLPNWTTEIIIKAAEAAHLPVVPTADFYVNKQESHEYLVNFSLLNEEQIKTSVAQFHKLLSNAAMNS